MKTLSLAKTFPAVTVITVFSLLAGLGCSREDSLGGVGDGAAPDTTTSTGGAGGGGASGSTGGASAGSGPGEDARVADVPVTDGAGDSNGGPEICPAGFVWMVSGDGLDILYSHMFDSFCGQTCAATSDCPSGMTCVLEQWSLATPRVPVCVSDTVPPPNANRKEPPHEDYGPICGDSMTLQKPYWGSKTGFVGVEVIPCSNGCLGNPNLMAYGGDSCSGVPLDKDVCDPFAAAPKPIVLGEILGAGKAADGTIYVVDQSNSVQRVFVTNGGTLVRQRIAGSGSTANPDGSKAYSFTVDWVTVADAGRTTFSLALEIDSQGKVRMGVLQGVLAGKGFVIGQQGEELLMLQSSAIAGMALRNLPGEVRLEYAAKLQSTGQWLVVTRPVDEWTYTDFRLFAGKPISGLVERKVTSVQRAKDGGSTTITFDNAGVQAVAKFPVVFADGGFVAGPATLESGTSSVSLDLQSTLPEGLSYRCLPAL